MVPFNLMVVLFTQGLSGEYNNVEPLAILTTTSGWKAFKTEKIYIYTIEALQIIAWG
jgi:hypothetical protein